MKWLIAFLLATSVTIIIGSFFIATDQVKFRGQEVETGR